MVLVRMPTRNCKRCADAFVPQYDVQTYCGPDCREKDRSRAQKERAGEREALRRQRLIKASQAPITQRPLPLYSELTELGVEQHRRLDCAKYEPCLQTACDADWKSFTCTGCYGHEPTPLDIIEIAHDDNA